MRCGDAAIEIVLVVVLVLVIGDGAVEDEKEDEDDSIAAPPRCAGGDGAMRSDTLILQHAANPIPSLNKSEAG